MAEDTGIDGVSVVPSTNLSLAPAREADGPQLEMRLQRWLSSIGRDIESLEYDLR
jgi:hypothetical protein